MSEENGNGNGRVTLALLGQRLDALIDAFEKHDKRQDEQFQQVWKYVRDDHEILITLPCEYHEKDLAKLDTSVKALADTDKAIAKEMEDKSAAVYQQLNVGKWLAGLMTTIMAILTYFSTLGRS
jgi:hypothetical protein